MKIKLTIDTSESDREFIKKFEEATDTLARIVIEAVREHPQYLLSPVMRKMMAEKADDVLSLLLPLKHKLCADNLGDDLRPCLDSEK